MAETKAPDTTLICDCGEGKKLSKDQAQVMHVISPRAEKDWVACRGDAVCHQKVQEKIAAAHNPIEEKQEAIVPAPPVIDVKNDKPEA